MNLLAPGIGEGIVARARVVKPGRTLTVSHAEVFAVAGAREKLGAAHDRDQHGGTRVPRSFGLTPAA